MRLKSFVVIAAVLGALPASARAAAVLQYQWQYNETGMTAPSTVPGFPNQVNLSFADASNNPADLHSADQLGVSGAVGDRAFNNSASASIGGSGGIARAASFTNTSVESPTSFAMTAWVNPSSSLTTGFGRIFILGAGGIADSGATNSAGFLTTNDVNSNGSNVLGLQFNIAGFQRSVPITLAQNAWTFVAVTFDDPTNTVRFYSGDTSTSSSLALLGSFTDFTQAGPDFNGAGTTTTAMIGNRDNRGRAFDGMIDDTRFYTGSFDAAADIDAVRLAALPNVPEPAAVGLLVAAAPLVGRRRRSR